MSTGSGASGRDDARGGASVGPEAVAGSEGGTPTSAPSNADDGRGADEGATSAGATRAADVSWNPEGTDLARALLSRAKAGPLRDREHPDGAGRRDARSRPRSPRGATGAGWSGPTGDDRDPQPLDRTVERLVAEHGWAGDLSVHGVLARWDMIVGPEVAAHVKPERYSDGELTVRADSSAWATQIRLLAPTLVGRINREIGQGTVNRVVVVGPVAPDWSKGRLRVRGRGPRDTYG